MEMNGSERGLRAVDWALLMIRIGLGVVFVIHGSQKLFGVMGGPGIGGVVKMVEGLGFAPPAFWAWMLVTAEFFGGLGVLFGLLTRVAALGILITMAVAVAKIHGKAGFLMSGGGYEYNMVLSSMAVALIIAGAGKLSLDWVVRWWMGRRRRETKADPAA